MKDETTGPPMKRVLSATAPVFKFPAEKEVPTETFSFNPESQEFTAQAPAGREEEQEEEEQEEEEGEEEEEEDEEEDENQEKQEKQEGLPMEDDLYLAALMLAGETNTLPQDPYAVSIVDVNNHPFNSIIIPNFWDPSEKHDGASGDRGRDALGATSLDPAARWRNGESSVTPGLGTWSQPPPLYPGANLMGFQPHPSANSGPLVRYADIQRPLYPGAPGRIYPPPQPPIGPRAMPPGLGSQPLYSQVHHNLPKFPDGQQGHPQGPKAGIYNGTEMVRFPHGAFALPYVPLAQHPGYLPAIIPLSQEMNQLLALQNIMNQGNGSYNASNQHGTGKSPSGLPPLSDLKFPERYEPGVQYIPRVSKSHYTDIAPPIDSDDGEDDSGDRGKVDGPELKSRGVFLRNVPRIASHLEIFQNIRGGTIDQVSFQDREGPLMDINIFFTTHKAAKAYANYVTDHGGIFWYSERLPSEASLIPSRDPGFLNMNEETAKAIQNNCTRCISIGRILPHISESQLRADIQSQTRRFKIDYEAFEFKYLDTPRGRIATAEIRFPSIKICLTSVVTLRGLEAYKGCVINFGRDECAGPLSELERKWRIEYEWCKSQGIFRDQRFPVTISREKEGGSDEEKAN